MPPTTHVFVLADKVLGGQLADMLATWRSAGVSTRAMAALLETELGIRLDAKTIRLWLQDIPQANGDPVEAAS